MDILVTLMHSPHVKLDVIINLILYYIIYILYNYMFKKNGNIIITGIFLSKLCSTKLKKGIAINLELTEILK